MTIDASKFSIDASGNLRQVAAFVPGTDARYSTLELHSWLQDLADNSTPSGDDNVSIMGKNPSEIAGKRNASRPTALTLLNGVNIDDATSQWFKFGSVEQTTGNYLYTGLRVLGSNVANSPIYIIQNTAKLGKYWSDSDISDFRILVKAKSGSGLIDSGNATVFSRKYGQTYSHFDVNLSAGSEQVAAISTALDPNVNASTMTPTVCAGYFSTAIGGTATPGTEKIAITYGDYTGDLGGGQGALLHKGTITLNGSITVAQAYQAHVGLLRVQHDHIQLYSRLSVSRFARAVVHRKRRSAVWVIRRWKMVCGAGMVAHRNTGWGFKELSANQPYRSYRNGTE